MLDKILALVKENAQSAVMDNPDIPEDKKESVIQEAASSVLDGIKGESSGGGLQNLISSFAGGAGGGALTGLIDKVKGGFVQSLIGKLGFNNEKATSIASALIPIVINKFFHKTADPSDSSFDLNGIVSSLSGGKDSGGIMGAVKGIFG